MNKKLFLKAIIRYILGVVLVGVLLFVPAGTLKFWNAWLFMGILFIPMFIAGIILMFKNPMLLKSRLDVKEQEQEQKYVIIYSGLMFLFNNIVIISSIIFLISYILYAEVLRENTYLSRTIKVQNNQTNHKMLGIEKSIPFK